MPAEHRLDPAEIAPVAVFGKHPGHGDFLSFGLPDTPARLLSDWLGTTLGEVRDLLGPMWEQVCNHRTGLRFWLGGAFGEGQVWRGALRMSHDKVGRSYPLLVLQAALADSLPLIQTDQDFYAAAEVALADLLNQAVLSQPETTADLAVRLAPFAGADPGKDIHDAMFWAMKLQGETEQLLSEVALTDLICGARARSYWWFANQVSGQSGILACQGFPDPQAMSWLISGGGQES